MTSQTPKAPNPWADSFREGFLAFDRWDGSVIQTWWASSEQYKNIQLVLHCNVNQVFEPADAIDQAGKTHNVYLGAGSLGNWQILEPVYDSEGRQLGGKKIWSPSGDKITSSTKLFMLVDRFIEIVDASHPLYQQVFSHPIEDSEAWLNMRAIFQKQMVEYKGLEPSEVELPIQILPMSGMVVPVGQQVQAPPMQVAAPAAVNVPPMAVAPPMAVTNGAPPPVQQVAAPVPVQAVPAVASAESWQIAASWFTYVGSICSGKSTTTAASECFRDGNIQGQALVMTAIQNGLINWMVQQGYLADVNGVYQKGPNAGSLPNSEGWV